MLRHDDIKRTTILNAIKAKINLVERPWSYAIAEVLVAIVMVALPLVYVAMICGIGWCVFCHATFQVSLFQYGRGGVLLYLVPIIVGPTLILFMVKPLFRCRASSESLQPIDRNQEPLLFDFVDRLCESVHAPKPKSIVLDMNVNASASFRSGLSGVLANDLQLTIGLPLVAGLNLRQLAGVLAHEFGHFAQGASMRLIYVIYSIHTWFARVVYERDSVDKWLTQQAKEFRALWVMMVFVYLTRISLWCLMMVGHVVVGHLLRQMEFDADRHEARLVGSDVFASTQRRFSHLLLAHQRATQCLDRFYDDGQLVENLPSLVLTEASKFSAAEVAEIEAFSKSRTTRWYDSHPCDADRIANTRRENAAGIFQLEVPASELFSDFDATSKRVTVDYYRHILGEDMKTERLRSNVELEKAIEDEEAAWAALQRATQGTYDSLQEIKLANLQFESIEPVVARSRLEALRAELLKAAETYKPAASQVGDEYTREIEATVATKLSVAGIAYPIEAFSLGYGSCTDYEIMRQQCEAKLDEFDQQRTTLDVLSSERIRVAISVALGDRLTLKVETRDRIRRLELYLKTLRDIDGLLRRCMRCIVPWPKFSRSVDYLRVLSWV